MMIPCLATSLTGLTAFARDVTETYIKIRTVLERNIYRRAPTEMKLPKNTVLDVIELLYRLLDSGLRWYQTYLYHHVRRFGIERITIDRCVPVRRDGKKVKVLVVLQVDDSLALRTPELRDEEERSTVRFKAKQWEIFTT